jgi:hypothetical protein
VQQLADASRRTAVLIATTYAAKLHGGQTSVVIPNKGAVADLEVKLEFVSQHERSGGNRQGKCSVIVPHSRGLHLTLTWVVSATRQQTNVFPQPIKSELAWPFSAGTTSSVDLFEVEISQIHVTACQDVYGENIFPFVKANFEKLRSEIPVVPLAPSQRVCRIICRGDL